MYWNWKFTHKYFTMSQSSQFYFTKELLDSLVKEFKRMEGSVNAGGRKFKGIVFTPGLTIDGNAVVFPFPLYSNGKHGGQDNDVIFQVTDPLKAGCPYPPPCPPTLKNQCY